MAWSIRLADAPAFVFPAKGAELVSNEDVVQVADLMQSIDELCKHISPVCKAQLIPENALLASCIMKPANGLSFLEILPTDLCNHACKWCFTASSRSTNVIAGEALRDRIEKFLGDGGKSILFSGGGEPLLSKPLSEPSPIFGGYTVFQWISSRNAVAALITNGVFLDKFLSANRNCLRSIAFLRVTLDAHSAARYETLHVARKGDFERVLQGLKMALRLRGSSLTPAIGISFIVDASDGLNCSLGDLEAINGLAHTIGVDFVQLKHVHTCDQATADYTMLQIGEFLTRLTHQKHEWWVHRYLSSQAESDCAVPMIAQVLRSDGGRSPCCHLQDFDVQEPADSHVLSPFRVVGCRSAACRYVSMNRLLRAFDHRRAEDQRRAEYVDALHRLKISLEQNGFHPYRLYPSAPDLVHCPSLQIEGHV